MYHCCVPLSNSIDTELHPSSYLHSAKHVILFSVLHCEIRVPSLQCKEPYRLFSTGVSVLYAGKCMFRGTEDIYLEQLFCFGCNIYYEIDVQHFSWLHKGIKKDSVAAGNASVWFRNLMCNHE